MCYHLTPTARPARARKQTPETLRLYGQFSRKHINISTRHIAIKSFMGAGVNVTSRAARGRHRGLRSYERNALPSPGAQTEGSSGQLPLYLDKRTRFAAETKKKVYAARFEFTFQ